MSRLIGVTILAFGLCCWSALFLLGALVPRLPPDSFPAAAYKVDLCSGLFFATACVFLGAAIAALASGSKHKSRSRTGGGRVESLQGEKS